MIESWQHQVTSLDGLDAFLAEHQIRDSDQLLLQLFSCQTDHDQLSAICRHLHQRLPTAALIGATTYCWLHASNHTSNGILLSVSRFGRSQCAAWAEPLTGDQFQQGRDLAKKLCRTNTKALILFATVGSCNGDDLLRGISSVAPNVTVAGGMASDRWTFDASLVMAGEAVMANGIAAVAIHSDHLSLLSDYSFGWRPIGRHMTVTKANGNRVYTIDDSPTQQIYTKYLGQEITNQMRSSSVDFPLLLERHGVAVARAPMVIHDDGSISFAGNFKEGDKVRFAYGDIASIGSHVVDESVRLPIAQAETVFVYSCAGRYNFLKESIQTELAPLAAAPNASGFLCYGEFFHRDGHNSLLNHTMTYLLLAEETPLDWQPLPEADSATTPSADQSMQALFNLVQVTSSELTNLNQQLEQRVDEKTEQLRQQIYTNSLTGLLNRRQLLVDLERSAADAGRPVHLALFDIDAFRQLNDVYGFAAGDQILQLIAERSSATLNRQPDGKLLRLYKLPSDEYAITAPSCMTGGRFLQVISLLEQAIESSELTIGDSRCDVQVTFGAVVAGLGDDDDDSDRSLLTKADIALRQARELHREMVIYNRDLPLVRNLNNNLTWLRRLRAALREERITAYFQPLYDATTLQLVKFEALVRLIDDQGKPVSPYLFLDVAKKSRLYHHLTQKVVMDSRAMVLASGVGVSINLSLLDLKHAPTIALIESVIADPQVGPLLTFEIVESEGFEDYSLVSDFIQRIKTFGCSVVIDDFGSGYSSYAHFAKLNVDGLKIDGSLIKTIDTDPRLRSVVHSIVDFAQRLALSTTAEFVHNAEVMALVQEMGIGLLQGFHLSPPVDASQALALVRTGQ